MKRLTRCLCAFLVLLLAAGGAGAAGWTYEELAEVYGAREAAKPEAEALEQELLREAGDLDGRALWRVATDPGTPPRERAAHALKLVRTVFPGGDPARWEEVSGFWRPSMTPRPLAALDAVFYAAWGLLELDDPGAPWLARELLADLKRSSRAAHLAMRTAPEEYGHLAAEVDRRTGLPPVGGWPRGTIAGHLPFARPVRSWVDEEYALMRDMTFLDNGGVPATGMGPYAWDRHRGAVYRVIVREDSDDRRWRLWP